MKRLTALLTACVLLLSLSACQYTSYDSEQAPVPDFAVSVLMNTEHSEYNSDHDTIIFTSDITTPQVSGCRKEAAAESINSTLAALSRQFKQNAEVVHALALDKLGSDEKLEAAYSYSCAASVSRSDTAILSIVYDVCTSDGSEGGYVTRTSCVFNPKNGEQLTLDSLSDDAATLRDMLITYIVSLASAEEYTNENGSIFFEAPDSFVPGLLDNGSWYFSDKGLVAYANPYSVADFEYGRIEFTVPYEVLNGLINDEYLPTELEGDNGLVMAELKSSDSELKPVCTVTNNEEGADVLISAEETVYDVRLYTASSEDGTNYTLDSMLWQRNYLSTGEAVELLTYIPDVIPNVIITYILSDGETVVRGISQSGKDGSVILTEAAIISE